MSTQIDSQHVAALQHFSLAGELDLFEKYGTDARRRVIDLFQVLARAGDDVFVVDGSLDRVKKALEALSAIGYVYEDLADGPIPVRAVGLEDAFTGTELDVLRKVLQQMPDAGGERGLVLRAVYGCTWDEIAADTGLTARTARSRAKSAAETLVRGYFASALTGCGETDKALPRVIFGLYADNDSKIQRDVEQLLEHEESCETCAAVRTQLSRALSLMAAVIAPRDLTGGQIGEIEMNRSLGQRLAEGLVLDQTLDAEAIERTESVPPPLPAFLTEPEQDAGTPEEADNGDVFDGADFSADDTVEFELSEIEPAAIEPVAIEAIVAAQESGAVATAAPAPVAVVRTTGIVDPGSAPMIGLDDVPDLAETIEEGEEDVVDLELYEEMEALDQLIPPRQIVVPALVLEDEVPVGAGDVFDWTRDGDLAEDQEQPGAHESDAIEASTDDAAGGDDEPEEIPGQLTFPGSDSELLVEELPARPLPNALVLDLATDGEIAETQFPEELPEGAKPEVAPEIAAAAAVLAAGGELSAEDLAPESDKPEEAAREADPGLEGEDAAEPPKVQGVERPRGASSEPQKITSTEPPKVVPLEPVRSRRVATATEEEGGDRRRVAGALLAAAAVLLLMVGVVGFGGFGSNDQPSVAETPAHAKPAAERPAKKKAKKHHRRHKAKKAKVKAAPVYTPPAPTYQPAQAPAPSHSSGGGVDDGSAEFLPEERG